jgi:hypothetical protein
MCRSCAPQPIVTPRRRIFEDIFDIHGVRLAGQRQRGLRRNKILAGVEIDRITSGIDRDR